MIITEQTIRERLAADQVKPCRVATWEEIRYLLDEVDRWRGIALRINDGLETVIENITACDHCEDDPPRGHVCPACLRRSAP